MRWFKKLFSNKFLNYFNSKEVRSLIIGKIKKNYFFIRKKFIRFYYKFNFYFYLLKNIQNIIYYHNKLQEGYLLFKWLGHVINLTDFDEAFFPLINQCIYIKIFVYIGMIH